MGLINFCNHWTAGEGSDVFFPNIEFFCNFNEMF